MEKLDQARHSKNQRNILTDHINQATGITNIFMRLEEDIQVLRKRKVSEKQAERVIKGFFLMTPHARMSKVEVLNEFHNEDRGTFGRNAYDLLNALLTVAISKAQEKENGLVRKK